MGYGLYHLVVQSAEPAGAYQLTLTCEPFNTCTACAPLEPVTCGETKTGHLDPTECDVLYQGDQGAGHYRLERWPLEVAAKGLYRIRVESENNAVGFPGDCNQDADAAENLGQGARRSLTETASTSPRPPPSPPRRRC